MATYSSHKLIMEKNTEIDSICRLIGDILFLLLQICLLSSSPRFICLLSKLLNLIGFWGDMKGNVLKNFKKSSSQKP